MRDYSRYLALIKSSTSKVRYDLSGTTPQTTEQIDHAFRDVESNGSRELLAFKKLVGHYYGVNENHIQFSMGSSQTLFQLLAAVTSVGDTILIEKPTYEPFISAAKFLGLRVRQFARSGDFADDFKLIKKMNKGVRAILISNPNCPMGWVYNSNELEAISTLGPKLIVDEIYLSLFKRSKMTLLRPSNSNAIAISGLSKSTGWSCLRVGWVKASRETILRFNQVGYQLHVDTPMPSIVLGLKVVKGWATTTNKILNSLQKNQRLVRQFSKKHQNVVSHDFKNGSFGALRIPSKFKSASEFEKFLSKKGVSVRSCELFGLNNHVRIGLVVDSAKFSKAFRIVWSCYE